MIDFSCTQVVADLDNEVNGVTNVVAGLGGALAQNKLPVTIYTTRPYWGGLIPGCEIKVYPAVRWPLRAFCSSPAMLADLRRACVGHGVIHAHGLWQSPVVYSDRVHLTGGFKLVISPHGMLSPWALNHSRWKKRIAGWLGQNAALRHADMFHATGEAEYADIRKLGFQQPVAVIPSGFKLPDLSGLPVSTMSERRRMLYLGRLHPIKGIPELLRIWQTLEPEFPDWDLELVGPFDDFGKQMQEYAHRLNLRRVVFAGAVTGGAKFVHYRKAALNVLPSHSENFAMTVAEALGCETPVLTTRETPWQGLETNRCGWWVPDSEEALTAGLRLAMNLPDSELRAMGRRGRDWMERDFTWQRIGAMMKAAYAHLVDPAQPRPNCMRYE